MESRQIGLALLGAGSIGSLLLAAALYNQAAGSRQAATPTTQVASSGAAEPGTDVVVEPPPASAPASVNSWPPRVGQPFPDVSLTDSSGKTRHLSEFRGKVILLELSAMSCPASQSLAGAHQFGSFGKQEAQPGLGLLAKYVWDYTKGMEIGDSSFMTVQALFYNEQMQPVTRDELGQWIEHFHLRDQVNLETVIGPSGLLGNAYMSQIPGFILIDRSFKVRYALLEPERQPLFYSELLPMIPKLVLEDAA